MPLFRSLAVLLALPLALGACGLFGKKRQPPCPRVSVLKDAARMTNFAPGGGTDLSALVNEVRLAGISAACEYSKDEVEVKMDLTLAARRGPADRSHKAPVRYFVAILGPDGKVAAKRVFNATVTFPVNIDAGGFTDNLVQKIPLAPGEPGTAYRIVAGLQLTPEQLKYNRRREKINTPGNLREIPIAPPKETQPAGPPEFPTHRERGGGGRIPGESY